MSFLESIQQGLEKASQKAAQLTKIQHLHNIANDLTFKASQQGQNLVAKAMEMYRNGTLAQGELTAICQQIATYEQQLGEVNEELERLKSPEDAAQAEMPAPPVATEYPAHLPPPPQGYPAGTMPPSYVPYPTPQVSYTAYSTPVQPGYPVSPSGEPPTRPGAPVQESEIPTQMSASSSEPPTRPGAPVQESELPTQLVNTPPDQPTISAQETQVALHKPHHHAATPKDTPEPAPATDAQEKHRAKADPKAGTYANGTLPPIYSPFASKPASASAAAETAEEEKPAKAHHAKKAADDDDAPEHGK